jgi:Zn-dependent peptidase ImmA (M78 family)
MDEYRVRLVDLPPRVGGMVSMDDEGFYNIYLNARLTRERQREVLRHELDHIAEDDLYNTRPITEVERRPAQIWVSNDPKRPHPSTREG